MAKTKWTPGPWRANWDDNGQWYIEPLGITGTGLRGDSSECLESANAHVIATAPDLYEALESLWNEVQKYSFGHEGSNLLEVMSDAKHALAKARGESDPTGNDAPVPPIVQPKEKEAI